MEPRPAPEIQARKRILLLRPPPACLPHRIFHLIHVDSPQECFHVSLRAKGEEKNEWQVSHDSVPSPQVSNAIDVRTDAIP